MEEQVGQVELGGGAWGEQPVQLKGEGGERPVGLVGASVGEWNAPEVRGDQGGEGGGASHKGVRDNSWPGKEYCQNKKMRKLHRLVTSFKLSRPSEILVHSPSNLLCVEKRMF